MWRFLLLLTATLVFMAFVLWKIVPSPQTPSVRSNEPEAHPVVEILTTRCARCHHADAAVPDLTTFEAVVSGKTEDGEPLVVPGNLKDSWLWEQLAANAQGQCSGATPDELLTQAEFASIEQWILNGAP